MHAVQHCDNPTRLPPSRFLRARQLPPPLSPYKKGQLTLVVIILYVAAGN